MYKKGLDYSMIKMRNIIVMNQSQLFLLEKCMYTFYDFE